VRSLCAALGLVVLVATASSAADTRLTLCAEPGAGRPPDSVRAELRLQGGEPGGSSTRVLALTPARPAELRLPRGSTWQLTCTASGYWAPTHTVVLTGDTAEISCTLWLTGRVSGRLDWPRGAGRPSVVRVSLLQAPEAGADQLEGTFECPVGEDGAFRCTVPAGTRDLRLRAAGFVSHYVWSARVPIAGDVRLGCLALRAGASLVGWIRWTESPGEGVTATIEASAESAGVGPEPEAAARIARMRQQVKATERGFFQFESLRPGSYRIVAHASDGARSHPVAVSVSDGHETELLDPLELLLPGKVEVAITPPADLKGDCWRLELWDVDPVRSTFEIVARQIADEHGWVAIPGLLAGEYELKVEDAGGQPWHSERLRLEPGGPPVPISLSFVRVRGTVSIGENPLAADVLFGGTFGAVKVRCPSDAKGSFACTLPHAGRWRVDVVAEELGVRRRFDDVDATPPKGKEEAELDLRLPDTWVEGRVVDEDGQPVSGLVTCRGALGAGQEMQVKVGADGRFALVGLDAGALMLQAETPTALSDWQLVVAAEGRHGDATLVVRERRDVRGRVVWAGAGIPGAEVTAFNPAASFPLAEYFDTTDQAGRFTLRVGPHDAVVLVAEPPGFARCTVQVLPDESGEHVIEARQDGGTLVILAETSYRDVVVLHGGLALPIGFLEAWGMRNGGKRTGTTRLEIPALEPGEYVACRGAVVATGSSGLARPGTCVRGDLTPRGVLTLTVPAPAGAEAGQGSAAAE
jgi:hypothetical protein